MHFLNYSYGNYFAVGTNFSDSLINGFNSVSIYADILTPQTTILNLDIVDVNEDVSKSH